MLTAAAKMNNKKRRASTTRRLHRSLGAGAALFVVFMVLSGLAINHSNGLGLDQRHVSQPFLLSWYGLGVPETIQSYRTGNDWISFAGSQLYLNDNPVSTVSGGVGAVFNGDMLIAAGSDELLLLNPAGELIERLPWDPAGKGPIEAIGLLENEVVVVQSASRLWLADAQLLNWQRADGSIINPQWSFSELAPDALQQTITQRYRGNGLSLERLLLDFHSGRIFGPIGVFVYDLLALAVGFLAMSGLVLWIRSRRNGKRK